MNRRGIRRWARRLKTEVYAFYLTCKNPRVPWYTQAFVAVVAGYAFSPIDLIPDFTSVLGYLDDIILVPLGIALAICTIPPDVLSECREHTCTLEDKPVNETTAAVVVLIWLILAPAAVVLILRLT